MLGQLCNSECSGFPGWGFRTRMQTLLQIAAFEIYCQFIVQFELLLGTMFGHGLKGERDAEKISLREIRVSFFPKRLNL